MKLVKLTLTLIFVLLLASVNFAQQLEQEAVDINLKSKNARKIDIIRDSQKLVREHEFKLLKMVELETSNGNFGDVTTYQYGNSRIVVREEKIAKENSLQTAFDLELAKFKSCSATSELFDLHGKPTGSKAVCESESDARRETVIVYTDIIINKVYSIKGRDFETVNLFTKNTWFISCQLHNIGCPVMEKP